MRRTLISIVVVLAAAALGAGLARRGGDGGQGVVVERVVDGDTIVVRVGRRTERVRYIGVDTPESVKPGVRVQCFAQPAAKANRALVEGRTVQLVADREARDRYGRTLAYVYRAGDGLFVNAELVRRGYAKPLTIPPNVAHEAEFRRLATLARRARRGLWSRC